LDTTVDCAGKVKKNTLSDQYDTKEGDISKEKTGRSFKLRPASTEKCL
jgi:hypothetical protein